MDFVFCFYGLTCVLLAAACQTLPRELRKSFPWGILALVCLTAGLAQWARMLALPYPEDPTFVLAVAVAQGLVSLLLFEFGRRALRAVGLASIPLWVLLPFLVVAMLPMLANPSYLRMGFRCVLGLPGGIAGAVSIAVLARRARVGRTYLWIIAASLAAYIVAAGLVPPKGPFLLSAMLNEESFMARVGVPVQMVRAILALVCLLAVYGLAQKHFRLNGPHSGLRLRDGLWLPPAVAALLVVGWIGTEWSGHRADARLRQELLNRTRVMALGIPSELTAALSGRAEDESKPAYRELKARLARMKEASPLCRFTYIMVPRGTQIVIMADSAPESDPDMSPAGQVYDEITPELRRATVAGTECTEGPYPDRWGTWVTAGAPIYRGDGTLLGVFGQDVDASQWAALIAGERRMFSSLTLLIIVLLATFSLAQLRGREVQMHLADAEKQLRRMFDHVNDAVFVQRFDGAIVDFNERAMTLFGVSREDMSRIDIMTHLSGPEAPLATLPALWQRVANGERLSVEWQCRKRTGEFFDAEVHLCRMRLGVEAMIVATVHDVSQRKALEAALRADATTDRLTGLANRACLLDRLRQALARQRRNPAQQFAVLFIDCDRFKLINDSLGHDFGDQLLIAVAERLTAHIREVDALARSKCERSAARLGGDEFVVLLEDLAAPGDAQRVAERLITAFKEPFLLRGHEIFAAISVGIVGNVEQASTPEQVISDADTAMYAAKLAGKSRFVVFEPSMRQRVEQRLKVEMQLRHAIEQQEFVLHYQPIVNLETAKLEGLEALVRWQKPGGEMVPPGEFVPIAEETGLIIAIDEWVLKTACRQFVQWQREDPARAPDTINVNLSRNHLSLPNLDERINHILAETGINPACVHLEITESAIMENTAEAAQKLKRLRALGVKLDMDDFGTGYSSLACLHQFPIDTLKIDRSFIANLGKGRDMAALVTAIVTLAQNLGIKVIAEGVETIEQLDMLAALDCDLAQGFLFGRPVEARKALSPIAWPEHALDAETAA